MGVGRLLPMMAIVAVAACGGGGATDGTESTGPPPSTTASTQPEQPEPTTPPGSAPGSAPTSSPPSAISLPDSWLRYGPDGLLLVDADREQLLVDRPIAWAASDGAGGVLFTEQNPDRFGPTWWLPAGGSDPAVVSEWDDPLLAALVGGRPAAVGSMPTTECAADGEVHMVARILTTAEEVTLQCGVGGQDAGREPDSFGGGIYVGVEWDAVHPSGRSTDIGLVFRDGSGAAVDVATNPYADDCSPCSLRAALAPDGSRLAVVHRPDAPPFRPDEYDEWLVSTSSILAELTVFDLSTGESVFSVPLAAGSTPPTGGWFDGRFVVVEHDAVTPADAGGMVTIIDTETGATTELPGRVALEVILTDGPPPGGVAPPGDVQTTAILRPDGLGPFTFGADAAAVEAWLGEQLGPPDTAIVEPGQGGWPLPSCTERRLAYWAGAGLTVGFTDLHRRDAAPAADCDDAPQLAAPHLAAWYVDAESSPWFVPGHGDSSAVALDRYLTTGAGTTGAGIGLGATAGELRAADASVTFGEWYLDEYSPSPFVTSDGMRGRVAWEPVADVQRALNELGEALAVDGTFGPRTQAATAAFQAENEIDEVGLGPQTLDRLGVAVPDGAPIVYLAAGPWEWNF